MIIRVGGIPGVGKTTIVNELLTITQDKGFLVKEAPVRETLRELAGVKTIEEYRALPEETRGSFYPEMEKRIYQLDRVYPNQLWIHDSHFSFFSHKTGQYNIRPIQLEDYKQLLAIVVVAANPSVICDRRIKDFSTRSDRHLHSVKTLNERQEYEIKVAQLQAEQLKVPIKILRNNDNDSTIDASKAFLVFLISTQE